jgi:hypothetical protein
MREPNQFANFADLFFERQLRELAAHSRFHDFGNFKLYRWKMSSSNGLSMVVCANNCSILENVAPGLL